MDNQRESDHKIRSYLRGEMSENERYLFEKEMQKDPFLAEAVEGYSMGNNIGALDNLAGLRKKIKSRSEKTKSPLLRIASIAIILIGISSVLLLRQLTGPDLVSESLTEKTLETEAVKEKITPVDDITEAVTEYVKEYEPASSRKAVSEEAALRGREVLQPEEEEIREVFAIDALEIEDRVKFDTTVSKLVESKTTTEEILAKRVIGVEVQADQTPVSTDRRESLKNKGAAQASGKKAAETSYMNKTEGYVSGRVIASDDDLPLPGVAITVKGTTRGTSTDIDGNFTLIADSGDVLLASFVGMESKEVELDKSLLGDIILEPSIMGLDEVVVIAYGTQGVAGVSEAVSVTEIRFDDEGNTYQRPLPDGGMTNFRKYISDNQVFPYSWDDSDREVVRLRFKVGISGIISELEIIRSPDDLFSREAIRLIEDGPKWNQAEVNGERVAETITIRIVFKR